MTQEEISVPSDVVLTVRDLTVGFATEAGAVRAVEEAAFTIRRGQTLGLVGESGCGKSVTAMAVMRLLSAPPAFVDSGRIQFEDEDLLTLPEHRMRSVRGNRIGMIFQEPMTSLNPCFTVGFQIGEVLRFHRGMGRDAARDRAVALMEGVGIGAAGSRVDQYPHQLSGGLRQRVMIAMALACDPRLLIADEPTTALDVTVQAQILNLLTELQERLDMSVLLITHDLGVVAESCDHVAVMYAGRIVESAPADDLFARPAHPYTYGLMSAIPRLGRRSEYLPTIAGMVPSLEHRPVGQCYFAERCPRAQDVCFREIPPLTARNDHHQLACWNPHDA